MRAKENSFYVQTALYLAQSLTVKQRKCENIIKGINQCADNEQLYCLCRDASNMRVCCRVDETEDARRRQDDDDVGEALHAMREFENNFVSHCEQS